MKGLRLLNNGEWNKPPVLTAARRIVMDGLSIHFSKCTLSDAASFMNGTSYDVAQLKDTGKAPIIRISNITDPSSRYLRTDERLGQKFWITSGDLLVSWSASFKSIIWSGPEGYLNQHIFKVTERSGFDRRFIRHAIEASLDEMQESVVGIGMMHLRRSDFIGYPVPAPPIKVQLSVANFLDFLESGKDGNPPGLPSILSEQRRIVARIEELAAMIEEAQALRRQAAEQAEALVPAAKTDLYNEALRLAGRMERLEDLCTRITDGTHITPRYVEVGIPFISVKDITGGRICLGSSRRISAEEHARLFRHCNPARDDVLLTKVGTIGYAKVVDVDEEFSMFVSLALLKLRKDRVLPRYIEHILNSAIIRDRATADTRGVGNQNLVLKFIKEFPIPAPTLPDQRRIVAELDALQAEVHALQGVQAETAAELDALLPSILDKAFKGEL